MVIVVLLEQIYFFWRRAVIHLFATVWKIGDTSRIRFLKMKLSLDID